MLLAAACVAVIYLAGVTGKWWPTPDSALYLSLARSLANGEGYRFNGSPCNIVTPGLPAILAGLRMLFGPGFWAPNLFMALCGLGSLALIYLSVARLSDKRTALAVALATGLSYTYFFSSHRILTDAPFAALFWAILYAYIRYRSGSARWLILAGLLSVSAVAVRAPGILFLGALAVSVIPDRPPGVSSRKGLIPAGVILAILVVLGVGFFIVARMASNETQIYAGAIMSKVNAAPMVHLRNIGMGLRQLPMTVSEMFTSQETYFVGLPALGLIGIGGAGLWRRRQRFILPLIVISVLALALYGSGHMVRPRYLMPIQPLLILAMIEGLCWSMERLPRWWKWVAKSVLFLKIVNVFTYIMRPLAKWWKWVAKSVLFLKIVNIFTYIVRPLAKWWKWVAKSVLFLNIVKVFTYIVRPLAKWWKKANLFLKVVTVFTILIIVCNAKLLRNAVYYSYLSYTPRYYEVVKGGKFAELFDVAEIIRRDHSDNKKAATNSDEVSILHYISERTVISLPEAPRNRPAKIKKVYDSIISRTDLKFIVLENGTLEELLENTPGLKLRHDGKRYRVYERE